MASIRRVHSSLLRPLILALACVLAWVSFPSELRAESWPAPVRASDQASKGGAQIPDACAFIPKAELEKLVGHELRDGVKKDAAPPMSQCSFTTPPGASVTRRFENPALPAAAGFDSLTVTTFATTVATFAESRKTMGAGSPEIPGVGDGAFLSGPAMIFVRVGTRGFSIRLYVNAPTTDAGRAQLQTVMLSLARAGVARLK
jgi:hypothetical protein